MPQRHGGAPHPSVSSRHKAPSSSSAKALSPSSARPSHVWKRFDSLVNFTGSEHPLADLIIFRDLSYLWFCQTFTRQKLEWGGGGGGLVHMSRESGGKDVFRPIFTREREFRRSGGASKEGRKMRC